MGSKDSDDVWKQLYSNPEAFGKWIAGLLKPVALFAANDIFAHFASVSATLPGVAVSEQLAILGVDNDTVVCDSARVPISSIQSPARKIGQVAAELLCDMIDGKAAPSKPILIPPSEIVVR